MIVTNLKDNAFFRITTGEIYVSATGIPEGFGDIPVVDMSEYVERILNS